MMKNTNLCLFLLSLLLTSCGGEYVPDPFDPRIPAHPAKGHDAAGALINGQVWRAVESPSIFRGSLDDLTIIAYDEDSTLRLSIHGYLRDDQGAVDVTLEFVLDNSTMNMNHILNLKDLQVALDGRPHYARLLYDRYDINNTACASISGQLHITNVQKGSEHDLFNIAGTFGFIMDSDSCKRVEVLKGRFDYNTTTRYIGTLQNDDY